MSNTTKYICLKVKFIKTFTLLESIPCGEKTAPKARPKECQNLLERGMFAISYDRNSLEFQF